jgi:hypothetical protein
MDGVHGRPEIHARRWAISDGTVSGVHADSRAAAIRDAAGRRSDYQDRKIQ